MTPTQKEWEMHTPVPGHRRRAGLAAGCCLAVTAVLAGCSGSPAGSSAGGAGGTAGGTLTIASSAITQSQAPTSVASSLYSFPAYDSLIYQTASGAYEPDLAASWGYVGTGNTTFQVTLRHGLRFSDGSPVTASAVAASLRWYIKTTPGSLNTGPVKDITAVGTDEVQIHYSTPVPYAFAIWSLSPAGAFGQIVGPYGVAHPTWLANHTDGVGPYVLDSAASTSGGTQAYLPNKLYFNQAAIKYDKVVVTPITDTSSALAAVQSGQAQVDESLPAASKETASSAGLQVITKPGGYTADLDLENVESGPLANLKVRQAIAYALPRSDILSAVFNGAGTATSSTSQPGYPGYNAADDNLYATDLAKAKQLMAEAGYPHGFTLSALTGLGAPSSLSQAIAVALQQINITINITMNSTAGFPQFLAAAQTKKYDAEVLLIPAESIYTLVKSNLAPGSLVNIWGATSTDLDSAMMAAASAPTVAAQATKLQQVTATLDRLLWIVPLAVTGQYAAAASGVHNVPATIKSQLIAIDPFSPVASQAWYGS